jgi:hypothetical protein
MTQTNKKSLGKRDKYSTSNREICVIPSFETWFNFKLLVRTQL